MNNQKRFIDKVTDFIFGQPIPVLSESDLELVRELSQKLDTASERLGSGAASVEAGADEPTSQSNLSGQLRKLAKTQFKSNTLQESQLAQQSETLTTLKKSLDQQEKLVAELAKEGEQAALVAQEDLLKSMLPALDSLDAAFGTGRRQVLQLPMSREVRQAVIAWLDGIRLARMRLLDLLAAHDIRPIPTVGQPFDPHFHIAVAVDETGQSPNGIITSQDRPGYASSSKVLREAEVVVARSK